MSPLFVTLLIIIFASFGLLAWHYLRAATTLFVGLLPSYLIRFSIGPLPTTALEILLIIILAIAVVQKKVTIKSLTALGSFRIPLLLLLAASCFSVAFAPDVFAALGLWRAYIVEPIIFLVLARSILTERRDWEHALLALALCLLFIVLIAVVQKMTGLGIPAPWDVETRATSIFPYPNAAGLFIAPLTAFAFALFFTAKRAIFAHRVWLPVGIAGIMGVVLTQTEAALVAIPAAVIIALLMSRREASTLSVDLYAQKKVALAIGSSAVFVAAMLLSTTVREKIFLQDYSGHVRLAQWKETVELLKDHPLTGAGMAGYPTALAPYHDGTLYEIFQYPHNIVLNVWVELSLLGLISFLFLGIVVVRTAWNRRDDPIVLAAFAALLTMAIHGLVDVPYFKNDLALLTMVFLALLLIPAPSSQWPMAPATGGSAYGGNG